MKMGGAGLSVAVAVLVMMVGSSQCFNMSSSSAGDSTASSSSKGWCDGHMIDGQCMLIAHAYGGGEQFEYLDLDGMDMFVEAESSRRGLLPGGVHKTEKALQAGLAFGNGNVPYTPPPNNPANNVNKDNCLDPLYRVNIC